MANDFLRLTDLSGSDTAGYVLCLHLGTAITGNTHSHAVHLHPLLHTATITGVGGEVRRVVLVVKALANKPSLI